MHFLLMLTLKLQTKSQILGILLAQENEYLIEKRDIHAAGVFHSPPLMYKEVSSSDRSRS